MLSCGVFTKEYRIRFLSKQSDMDAKSHKRRGYVDYPDQMTKRSLKGGHLFWPGAGLDSVRYN